MTSGAEGLSKHDAICDPSD